MTEPSDQATPPPIPRRRSSWRLALIAAAFIVACLGLRVAFNFVKLVFAYERVETEAFEGLYGQMVEEHRKDPAAFEAAVATTIRKTAMKKHPGVAGFRFDERARVTDLGTALRVASGMRGVFAGPNSAGRETEMEMRTYYYDRGMSYLLVVCITGPSSCADKADLVERSERALLARLDRPAENGILPDGGECGPSGQGDAVADDGHTCHYPSDVSLTLYRKDEEETRRLIRSTLFPD